MPGGLHAPTEVILAWPTPNYVNPITRPNTILIVACICGPVTSAMLMARLWVRISHQHNPGWDDWLVVAGTIPALALTIVFPLATRNGFDRHIWDINLIKRPDRVVVARKYILAILCIFCVASGLIKISILLFYRRLSSRVVSAHFRWATWITIGFIGASSIAFTIVPIFGCDPISAFWDQANYNKLIKGYKYRCFDEGADVLSASIISTAQDLITAVLPTFLYCNLRIPARQKIAPFSIFALGYGVAALGVMRAYYSWKLYYASYDVTWVAWDLFLVTMLELHVGCFCANAPTLKVFLKYLLYEKLNSSSKGPDKSKQKGHKDSGLSGTQTSKSSASTLKEKVCIFFSKDSSTRGREGYPSEPHTNVSVYVQGGVQVEKEIHVAHSPALTIGTKPIRLNTRGSIDTTEIISAHYYDDIELGRFTTRRNSQVSSLCSEGILEHADIQALPAIPPAIKSPQSTRSFLSFRQSRSPQSSTYPERLSWLFPVSISEEKNDDGCGSHLFPQPSSSQNRPQWQTWT